MPVIKLPIQPGIYTEDTDLAGEARWVDGNNVRFFKGSVEKVGGWAKQTATTFTGVARGMHGWIDFNRKQWVAIGTHLKLYIFGTTFTDITPIRATTSAMGDPPFSMTDGSAVVTVTDTSHGAITGDYVTFSGAAAAGGITIDGEYAITLVDPDTYTITHSSAATSTTTGGGASVTATYQINVGRQNGVFGLGWGGGMWDQSTWNTARSTSNFFYFPRSWSFANWGEDLICNPRGGGIYTLDASSGITSNRATVVSNAPTSCTFVLVTPESRHLVAYGAHDGSAANPLLIRWSTREDNTSWTATATNTAGSKLLDRGSEILSAVATSQEILIFTDESVHIQRWIGGNAVFSFSHLGDNIGIIGPHAYARRGDIVFWMSADDFYVYDGQVRILDCDVKSYVFNNITTQQREKCHAGVNTLFDEVWWFYPRTSATEISNYVIYNYKNNSWSIGTLDRTSWLDRNETSTLPRATSSGGLLYNHESGTDDDTSAMSCYVESGDFDIGDGHTFMEIGPFYPDFKNQVGNVQLTVKARNSPNATEKSVGPINVTTSSKEVGVGIRGRQAAFRLTQGSLSDHFRAGTLRFLIRPDGI